jgi:hypothetical protein
MLFSRGDVHARRSALPFINTGSRLPALRQKDITGSPDDTNGRFEEIGWTKSFETYDNITRYVNMGGKKKKTKTKDHK